LGSGDGPFGKLGVVDLERIADTQRRKAQAAESGLAALTALDALDISTLWEKDTAGIRPVDALMEKLSKIVPTVYWQHLFTHFLTAAAFPNSPDPHLDLNPQQMAIS
jgi:hypothetical protein